MTHYLIGEEVNSRFHVFNDSPQLIKNIIETIVL